MRRRTIGWTIAAAAGAALFAASSCDNGRDDIFTRSPRAIATVPLDGSVAYVSGTLEKAVFVSWSEVDGAPAVASFKTGRDPVGAQRSSDGERLLVLCGGAQEGEVNR